MSFNGFNQNNSGSNGRSRNLFTFGASQNNPNSSAGFGNQASNGNTNPVNLGFGNQNRPTGQNPGFGLAPPNLVSFGSNSNNGLSSQPPQKVNINFTNRSETGRVVFKATAGTSTFRPPAIVNSVRPRPLAENSVNSMKFNLTWDPKASPERPVFPNNGISLGSSSDHILSNQRRRDNAFSQDNTNIRSLSCLTDMTPKPTIFNSKTPSSGSNTILPSTLPESSAFQANTSSNPATPSIFTNSLVSQPPEARKNIFNFPKTNAVSEVPKTAASSEASLVPASSSEKNVTAVSVSVSKPFEAPKFTLPTSLNGSSFAKPSSETGKTLPTTGLPSLPSFGNYETKSTPTLFASSASQATTAQTTKPSLFNIPSKTDGSLSGGLFGINSAKTKPNGEPSSSKPVNVTPSLPSLFSLSKFKSNATQKPTEGDKNKGSLPTEPFVNPFLTKKSFSGSNSKNNFSALTSSPKRPFDDFGASNQSKKISSNTTGNKPGLSTSKELVISDKPLKPGNILSTSVPFASSLSASNTRPLGKPTSNSPLNTNQSNNSVSFTSPERLNKLNNSLISQIKVSMAKNPFKSFDEIIIQALNDKDKMLLHSPDSNETPSGLKIQESSLDLSTSKKPVANTKEIDIKTTEVPSSNKFSKFNFSFENSSKSTPVTSPSNHLPPLSTSSPPKTKAFKSFTFSNQSDPKPTNSFLNTKLALPGTSDASMSNNFQPSIPISFEAQTSLSSNLANRVAPEKADETSINQTKPFDNSFKTPTVSPKPSLPLFSFTPNQATITPGKTSDSPSFSPRFEIASTSAKDASSQSDANSKVNSTSSNTTQANPLFKLGLPNISTPAFQTNSKSGASQDAASNPQPIFQFGLTDSSKPTSQPVFKFGLSDDGSAGSQPGLKSTPPENPTSITPNSSKTGVIPDNTPIGQAKMPPLSLKFGSPVKNNVPHVGLNFGVSGTNSTVSNDNKSNSTDSQPLPIFKFGSPNAESSFTQKPNPLGSSDGSKSVPSPIFKFGSSDSGKPVFKFGSSAAGPSSTPSFKFNFDSNPKDKDKVDSESTAPKLNLSFGLPNLNSDNTGFKFSLPNSSLNESSAAEPKSDSEPDPAEEGFSGARTNDALIVRGQGEEEETSLIQLTIKLLAYDITKKSYTDMGVGILKVNQHDSTKKQRVVCRAEGSGRLLLNANLPAQSAEAIPKPRGVRLRINNLEGIPSMFIVRIRTDAEVEQFIDVLKGAK